MHTVGRLRGLRRSRAPLRAAQSGNLLLVYRSAHLHPIDSIPDTQPLTFAVMLNGFWYTSQEAGRRSLTALPAD
jgi:hypothetical protein